MKNSFVFCDVVENSLGVSISGIWYPFGEPKLTERTKTEQICAR